MESDFAKLAISSDEKQQTGWFDLPYEMRIMIIEMMDTKTKGKLSSCSKLCCKEVRGSEDYINYISIRDEASGSIKLTIGYQICFFRIVFSNYTGYHTEKCIVSYDGFCATGFSKQEKLVDGSLRDVVSKQFNRFVNDSVQLKEIVIDSTRFPYDKTSIAHLTKLRHIKIENNGWFDLLKCGFLSIDQLSASQYVNIEGTNIEIDQLINFKSRLITLRDIPFSQTQLKQYLESWNNNQIDENVEKITMEYVLDFHENSLYSVIDDIVSGSEVVSRKNKLSEKWYYIKNSVGKLARLHITYNTIDVDFNVYNADLTSEDDDDFFYDSDDW